MRVRIIFTLKNRGSSLPFHHHHILSDFIKRIIFKGENSTYFDFRYYNFSGLKGQTKISKKGLEYLSHKTTLVLSSPDVGFINYFLQTLFKIPSIELGELILYPLSVEKEEAQEFGEEVKYICISPLVVVDPLVIYHNNPKNFIEPESDLFSDLLYELTMQRMEKLGAYTPAQIASFFKFQVLPDKDYLSKIKSEEKKFARIYNVSFQDKRFEVRGYTFPFTLFAAPEVQSFLFDCGLGAFTDLGFGMLDLAAAAALRKTVPYQF